jgi:hypothetical protein
VFGVELAEAHVATTDPPLLSDEVDDDARRLPRLYPPGHMTLTPEVLADLQTRLDNDPDPEVQAANKKWDEFEWYVRNGGTYRDRARRAIAARKAREDGAPIVTALCPHCHNHAEVVLYKLKGGNTGWDCPACLWHYEDL